ncbi:MAG TPA: hypothetical protein PKA53_01115 [Sphingobacterium sp.]|nr:hypothetical protein [Sphingobacterium sp.]
MNKLMKSKSLLLSTILLAVSISFVHAQSSTDSGQSVRKNDIMIDPIFFIAGPIINASYERILNEDFGIGVNTLFGLGTMDEIVQVSPYVRMYLGKHYASGFFIEGFAPVTSTDDWHETYDPTGQFLGSSESRETSVGLGVGLGGKWVLKRNILFELGGGVARRLFYDGFAEPVTGKWMIGIGYRF